MEDCGKLCEIRAETYQEWAIKDFFSLPVDKQYCQSSTFTFMNTNWCLRVYPTGSYSAGFISVYLMKESPEFPKTVTYAFGIKKADGTVKHIFGTCCTFGENDMRNGKSHFFERSELLQRKSELVPSDVLTITCTLKHGNEAEVNKKEIPLNHIGQETLSANFENLLASKKNTDVTLKVMDTEFQAHKLILAARSSVFSSMFDHDMLESKTGVITISDCDPDSFGDFLKYLYSGNLESISCSNVLQLYRMSDKYNVQGLKTFCIQYMLNNMKPDNVYHIATIAELYDLTDVLSAAQTFFDKKVGEIVLMPEWDTFAEENHSMANRMIIEMTKNVRLFHS